jgi:hypothetical protein
MCGDSGNNKEEMSVAGGAWAPDATVSEAKVASFNSNQSSAPVIERKLIKNGDLSFETDNIKKTKGSVETICKEFNAYISNENQNNFEERIQYNQTIRVPADKFDILVQRIEAYAVKVDSKNINTQDVTEEFIDVEARLKTKKELEARYREILKQAKTVQDIVSIEGQISNVRSEIESMEGRLNFLKNQVGFSTLNVSYYEIIGTDFGFATKLVRALHRGWDNLLSFMILTVNLWPFILLVFGFVFGIRLWRKRKSNQSSV